MTSKQTTTSVIKPLAFLIGGAVLAYFALVSRWELALVFWLVLGALFVWLRPFDISAKVVAACFVIYLAVAGLLNFAQPIVADSWPIFSVIILLSAVLQPIIYIFAIDATRGLLERERHHFDMAAVVAFWLGTLAVALGSTALLHSSNSQSMNIFVLFLLPWFINGAVFLAAGITLLLLFAKKRSKKPKN